MYPRSALLGIILLWVVLVTTGCEAVLSTTQLPPVREGSILGEWKDLGTPGSKPDADRVIFRFVDGEYRAESPDDFAKGDAMRFTLARAGKILLVQSSGHSQCDEFGVPKGQPCWSLSRLELLGDRINVYDFDLQRLGRESFGGALNVAHSLQRQRQKDGSSDTSILLSADSSELELFMQSYVKRPGVFRLTGRLQRISKGVAQ